MVYDELVALGHFHRISEPLKAEFGNPEQADLSYSDMTKDQLKSHAGELGLKFNSKATKDDLVVLLENKSDEEVPAEVENGS